MRGGWQRGVPHEKRDYLPLTGDVLAAHLKGDAHVSVYPLLDGDRRWWLVADFDGQDALTEALMYVKAGRALGVSVALEVSRSGVGMHAWTFFTAPVAAETARRLGTGLLREAMAIRGKVNLASYDRLFPSQDLLPAGGVGNLIALPLFRPARDRNATVFLNLESLEPHQDRWAFLSAIGRMTPREVTRAAEMAGREVARLTAPVATKIRPESAAVVRARLGAGVRVELADVTPALAASLRHHPLGLRHTFAVELEHAGTPVTVISKLLGHSSVPVTAATSITCPTGRRGAGGRRAVPAVAARRAVFPRGDLACCFL